MRNLQQGSEHIRSVQTETLRQRRQRLRLLLRRPSYSASAKSRVAPRPQSARRRTRLHHQVLAPCATCISQQERVGRASARAGYAVRTLCATASAAPCGLWQRAAGSEATHLFTVNAALSARAAGACGLWQGCGATGSGARAAVPTSAVRPAPHTPRCRTRSLRASPQPASAAEAGGVASALTLGACSLCCRSHSGTPRVAFPSKGCRIVLLPHDASSAWRVHLASLGTATQHNGTASCEIRRRAVR